MTRVQLAVVGGGPAGLSAAIAAAQAGVQVTLFDEQSELGGQLRYRLGDADADLAQSPTLIDRRLTLIAEAEQAGVTLRPKTTVWGIFPGPLVGIAGANGSTHVEAEQLILATGSTDLPLPFPGGSRPGVMTARGLQLLLHVQRVRPGERFAIIGTGDQATELARDITLAGGQVIGSIAADTADLSAKRTDDGARLALHAGGSEIEIDVIVIATGRQPDGELAMMAECNIAYSERLGGLVPIRDVTLRSSVPGILVAGDAAGTCEVDAAMLEGAVAGISAAAALGLVPEGIDSARNVLDDAQFADFSEVIRDRIEQVSSLPRVQIHV